MSLLVIGATGTLGRQIVRRALDEGYEVSCLVRNLRKAYFLKEWGAELLYGDLSLPETIPMNLIRITAIIDASTARPSDPYKAEKIDLEGKIALLEAAKVAGIKRFIFFSVLNAKNYRHLSLVNLKFLIEEYLQNSNLDYTTFQLSGFFQGLISQYAIPILEKQTIWVTGENTKINYMDTNDIAKFAVRSLNINATIKHTIPLVGLKSWNSEEIIQLCERLSGQKANITKIPLQLLVLFKYMTGFFEWTTNISERLAFAEILNKGQNVTSDMQSTYSKFGFEETDITSLESYMQDYFGRILRRLKELSDERERTL